ncbi:MAG TPA: ISL3 family transposase [Polyangiaceae bacterium]|nr:ISL3 family transposase [Polyangiaceae bacterium]
MRATRVLRTLLALPKTRVVDLEFEGDALVVHVAPTWQVPRCSDCGKKCRSSHDSRVRDWRHIDLGGIKTILRYRLRRVSCKRCSVLVEKVPWAESASRYTRPMEGLVAYHAQKTDKTTVATLMRIAWRTVGQIVTRFVHREREEMGDPLDHLRHIGVDEISYRKHHQYITTVVDHDRGIVVWAAKGKSAETLKSFFKAIGPERAAKIEAVTIDMSSAFIKAVKESVPNATLIFDRFHVQRLVHDALDEVRRDEVRSASADEKTCLKKTRWPLQKRPWNLSNLETVKLADLEEKNLPIYRAYLLKESLAQILDRRQAGVASRKLDEWLDEARSSELPAFVRVAGTIEKHRDGILAYVRTRLNNGRVEGLNGKTRVITRRAFGLHSASSLIAMLFLCCGGIETHPFHIAPHCTH